LKKLKFSALLCAIAFLLCFIAGPKDDFVEVKHHPTALISEVEKTEDVSFIKKSEQMIEPTVILYLIQNGTSIGNGTAFSIAYDRKQDKSYFLTNDHICDGTGNGIIMVGEQSNDNIASFIYDNSPDMFFELVDTSPADDLCLVSTKGYWRPVKINKRAGNLNQMDKLYIVGSPTSNFPIIIDTYFSGYMSRNQLSSFSGDGSLLMISEEIHPGHSGSPVFNDKGELVGIVSASTVRGVVPGGLLFSYGGIAIPLSDILVFLDKNNIK